ncbi:Isochorismatase family protein [Variovorax sp. SRS16]|nr:Isochorismatase family protein [Variovorax sp. SRS16]
MPTSRKSCRWPGWSERLRVRIRSILVPHGADETHGVREEYGASFTRRERASAMKSCLIVIDAQESFRQRPYFTRRDFVPYIAAQNALIEGCIAAGIPIVRIFHVDGPASASNPFAVESGHVRPLEELARFDAAATFTKHRHSALVHTGLEAWLTEKRHRPADRERHPYRAVLRNHDAPRIGPRLDRRLRDRCDADLRHGAARRPALSGRHQGTHRHRAAGPLRAGVQRRRGTRARRRGCRR